MDSEELQLLEDCEKREAKLSAWEHDFIVNLRDSFTDRKLSEKQLNHLNEIWEKVT